MITLRSSMQRRSVSERGNEMAISEPTIGSPGTYRATFTNSDSAVDASSTVSVLFEGGEESWTQEGLNALLQSLIDTIAANPQFEFQSANWNSGVNSAVTVTPPPEEPAPEGGNLARTRVV